jgi:hypothetical protein
MVVVLVDKKMASAAGVCKRNNDETVVSARDRGDSSALVCGYALCITKGIGQSKLAIYVKRGSSVSTMSNSKSFRQVSRVTIRTFGVANEIQK